MDADSFEKALADVRQEAGAGTRVQLLRVDRGQVWVVCGNDRFSGVVRVTTAGTDVTRTGAAVTSTLRLDDIDPNAPQRMLAALKKRGTASSKVDYASVLDFAGDPRWSIFTKGTSAKHFSADGAGRNLRPTG